MFWIAAVVGAAVVITLALQQSGGEPTSTDLHLFAALLVCAAGYTEGATLTRELPSWQVTDHPSLRYSRTGGQRRCKPA